MSNIYLPIREILRLRQLFKYGHDLDFIKTTLRQYIDEKYTLCAATEKYHDDLDIIFACLINMSLEDILYSCAAELFNKNVMVNVEYK